MEPKEKAVELVKKYYCEIIDTVRFKKAVTLNEAKKFALIAIDEIMKELISVEFNYNLNFHDNLLVYWNDVKVEIGRI